MPTNKRAKREQQKFAARTREDELSTSERQLGKFFPGPRVYDDYPMSETLPTINQDQALNVAIGRFCTTFSILHSEKTLGEMQRNAARGRG